MNVEKLKIVNNVKPVIIATKNDIPNIDVKFNIFPSNNLHIIAKLNKENNDNDFFVVHMVELEY